MVFVPGVLGTTLVDASLGGSRVWGSASGLLRLRRDPQRLAPGGVLWSFQVVPHLHSVPVYEPLARSLEPLGYPKLATGETGRPGLHGLAYDWRDPIVSAARAVEAAVDRLTSDTGFRRVHLIGHSWGCDVIRYYLRYGGADLLAEAQPEPPRPGAARVASFFAIGPLYGGTLRALHEANHGFAVAPFGLGVAAHQAAMTSSLYDLLSFGAGVVDTSGRRVEMDLADPATWREYGFGPFRQGSFERLMRRARETEPGLARDVFVGRLERFLERNLRRGRRLWQLQRTRDPLEGQVRTVTYTTGAEPTLTRLVMTRDRRPQALASVESVRRRWPELLPGVSTPGDGYVSLEQVRAETTGGGLAENVEHVPEGSYLYQVEGCSHRTLVRHPDLLRNLSLNLARPGVAAP